MLSMRLRHCHLISFFFAVERFGNTSKCVKNNVRPASRVKMSYQAEDVMLWLLQKKLLSCEHHLYILIVISSWQRLYIIVGEMSMKRLDVP